MRTVLRAAAVNDFELSEESQWTAGKSRVTGAIFYGCACRLYGYLEDVGLPGGSRGQTLVTGGESKQGRQTDSEHAETVNAGSTFFGVGSIYHRIIRRNFDAEPIGYCMLL